MPQQSARDPTHITAFRQVSCQDEASELVLWLKGDVLQRQGEHHALLSEVVSGLVVMRQSTTKFGDVVVDIAGRGTLIGGAQPGSADVTIIAATQVQTRLLKATDTQIVLRLFEETIARLRRRNGVIAHCSAIERVAYAVLTLALYAKPPCKGQHPCGLHALEFDLQMTRKAIAGLVGVTNETISRCFTRLISEGVIKYTGPDRVRMLDPAALIRLAGNDGAFCICEKTHCINCPRDYQG
ncbi:MAG: Crp/Fnr family transcriptional regulator [Alphaproteobacteria bacterium]|nr:Crp/Fnr family transcriptional regulator [Alphaproteobacteria bacterium]